MKMLILMPCDEQHVYAATAIYNALPQELKDNTFAMPMFMEYLRDTNQVGNWVKALFYTILAAEGLYAATPKNENFILIGNIGNEFKFDVVFNFQDIDESLPYEDKFMDMCQNIVKDEPSLFQYIAELHQADESKMALQNCVATADFITDYIASEPDLAAIKEKFKDRIPFKEIENNNDDERPGVPQE